MSRQFIFLLLSKYQFNQVSLEPCDFGRREYSAAGGANAIEIIE